MPNFRTLDVQTNFSCGEIDPKLHGRIDLKKYRNALNKLQNMIVMPQGGITRAPGTKFCAATKGTGTTILVPFQYSLEQVYMIEMGDRYFRFFKDEAQIMVNNSPVELAHSYLEDELVECNFFQSANVLYITHKNHPPAKLTRSSHVLWSLSNINFSDGPYLPMNNTSTTMTVSAVSGGITITSSAVGVFVPGDIGRHIRILHGAQWGWAIIAGYISSSMVSANVQSAFGATTASTNWRLGAFSDTTGWPEVAMVHDERLFFACTDYMPDGLWGSKVSDYEVFSPSNLADGTVSDSNSVYGTITSDQVNAINWIVSTNKGMLMGSIGCEWSMSPGSSTDAVITPASKSVKPRTSIGSARYIKPIKINNVVLFLQYMRKKVFEFVYKFENDDYAAIDLTIMAWHLLSPCIRTMCYQQEPFGTIWMVTDTNELVGMTYLREQDVVGCFTRKLGGTDVRVKWAASIPSRYIEYSQLWLVVKRTVNGQTVQYIEYADKLYETTDETDKSEAYFVDCGLQYDGALTNIFVGFGHLIGETVQVLGDGRYIGDFVVAGDGTVTIPENVYKASVGLGNEVLVKLLPIEGQGVFGTEQGQIKRVHECTLKLYQTDLSIVAYFDENNADEMDPWRD